MRSILLSALFAAALPAMAEPSLKGADEGLYDIEPSHAFLTWTVRHNGLSGYTVNFTDFQAELDFNPEDPVASTLSVSIDPTGIQTLHPGEEKRADWQEKLINDDKFLNADEFPDITFVSTSIEKTGEFTGLVTGDLTFLGVTKPVTLDVQYNGVTNVPWFGRRDVIGFDATTTLKRSDFGQTSLKKVVSDEVVVKFSGEFLQRDGSAPETSRRPGR